MRARAGEVRVLVAMIAANLYSKTLVEFVAFYKSTTDVEQDGSELFFGFKFTPSCWYDVCAKYPEPQPPWMAELLGDSEAPDRACPEARRPAGCIEGCATPA